MTNEDYQLEELENAAVNKSNNAKRAAAAAALLAAGGAAGYAATTIPMGSAEEEPVETLTEEDLEGVADTGAKQVQEPVMKHDTAQQTTQKVAPTEPAQKAEDEVDMSFDKTTHYYDEDNNLVMTTEEGTINGRQFQLVDVDGDKRADMLGYDNDGNGVINQDELYALSEDEKIPMGHATPKHDDVFLAINDPEPEPYIEPYDIDQEKDYADNNIHNDFENEKAGESYSHDYAENSGNYNNNADVESYSAGSNDYAYEEDVKDEEDYDYNDLAENETTEDSLDDLGTDSFDLV